MCTPRRFSQRVDLFAPKFYLDRVVIINHSGQQKTETLGYPEVRPHRSAFSGFNTTPEFDGRTDGFTLASTALAKLALARCKNAYD